MPGRTRARRATTTACALLCMSTFAAPAIADEDAAAPMYRADAIAAIDLQLPPASVEALEEDPEGDYVEGTFSLAPTDGTPDGIGAASTPLTVGIRLKGGLGSFRELKDGKAAFKVKFNEFVKGQKFLGLKKLTLNNMVQDPSMLHETLSYEVFRLLGVPSPRTGYAYVRVNGEGFGVYLNIETYDDVSLPRWFASTRHLYEADTPGVDVAPDREDEFEVDEGDDEDLDDLKALIAAADAEGGDWSDGMAPVADLTEMTRMWAVERYVGHWDGYAGIAAPFRPNNYYLHDEDTGPGAGVFQMLPWGTDQTWGVEMEFDEPAGGLLFNNCLADASCQMLYVDALRDLQASIGALDLDAEAACLADRLAPWQAMEAAPRREYDASEIEMGVMEARELIADRPQELGDWLATQLPQSEGAVGSGADPCGPQEPGRPDEGAPAPGSPPAAGAEGAKPAWLRVGRTDIAGSILRTRVWLPGPGRVRETAKLGRGRGTIKACATHARLRHAGRLTLRCRLSPPARRRLAAHGQRIRIAIRFKPQAGKAKTVLRRVFAPRQPSG